jgi:PAS domain S-box-containing protein
LVTTRNAGEVLEAIRSGVADCLIRDELDASRIERTICFVVEQARGAALQIERERRYLALLDNAGAIIYTHDLNGNMTSVNLAGERLTGFSQQELLGSHVSQLVDPAFRSRARKMIERTLDAQVKTVVEMELLTKEGHNLAVTVGVHPIYRQGKAIEIQGIVTALPGLEVPGLHDDREIFSSRTESQAWRNRARQFNPYSGPARRSPIATEMSDSVIGPTDHRKLNSPPS